MSTREVEFALFTTSSAAGSRYIDLVPPPQGDVCADDLTQTYIQGGLESRSVNFAKAIEGAHHNQNQNQNNTLAFGGTLSTTRTTPARGDHARLVSKLRTP